MHRLNVLDRLHKHMLDCVGSALPLLTSSLRDADLIGLAHLREEMIWTLGVYTRYVHREVLEAALAEGDADRIRTAQRIKADCIKLEDTYRAFAARWAYRDGMANWPEYRLSAIVMMKQVRAYVREAPGWQPRASAPETHAALAG